MLLLFYFSIILERVSPRGFGELTTGKHAAESGSGEISPGNYAAQIGSGEILPGKHAAQSGSEELNNGDLAHIGLQVRALLEYPMYEVHPNSN